MIGAGLCLLGSSAFVGAQSASAASGDPGYVLAFTNIYSGPADWYSVQSTTTNDAWIPFQCYQDTQDGTGQPWHRWFKVNQSKSYIRTDRITNQPSLPHC